MKILFIVLLVIAVISDLYLMFYVTRYAFDKKEGNLAPGITGMVVMAVNICCVIHIFIGLVK